MLITFEGPDGSSKTTQLKLLEDKLKSQGLRPVVTKEPGSPLSMLGKELRYVLFEGMVTTKGMAPGVADLIYLADHIQHVEMLIKPALANGEVVISDRYADSQVAYGAIKKCPEDIQALFLKYFGPIPDATILLLGNGKLFEKRIAARTKETHQLGKAWGNSASIHDEIQTHYIRELAPQPRTIVIYINEADTPEYIHSMVWTGLLNKLPELRDRTSNISEN